MRAVHAVILAGGSGTRFWPASRRATPKQLLAIAPGSDESLIAATMRRIEPLVSKDRILIATGAHLVEATQRSLPGLSADAFLGEPFARNTAACIGWATSIISRTDPDAIVMVLPSDHLIADEAGFRAAAELAIRSAELSITTIGIAPTRADTGYGYIEAGDDLGGGVRRVVRFVEKPDRVTAEQYIASGRHFWNAGMFFFRADRMLAAISVQLPDLALGLDRIARSAARGPDAERQETTSVFEKLTPVSIDYGLMEKEPELRVVPASFGWSDLGSWQSAWELAPQDAEGNAAEASSVLIDARGNLIRDLRSGAASSVVAVLGVSDVCVIVTDDALLVIPRDRAQDVRQVVDELARRGRDDAL